MEFKLKLNFTFKQSFVFFDAPNPQKTHRSDHCLIGGHLTLPIPERACHSVGWLRISSFTYELLIISSVNPLCIRPAKLGLMLIMGMTAYINGSLNIYLASCIDPAQAARPIRKE